MHKNFNASFDPDLGPVVCIVHNLLSFNRCIEIKSAKNVSL